MRTTARSGRYWTVSSTDTWSLAAVDAADGRVDRDGLAVGQLAERRREIAGRAASGLKLMSAWCFLSGCVIRTCSLSMEPGGTEPSSKVPVVASRTAFPLDVDQRAHRQLRVSVVAAVKEVPVSIVFTAFVEVVVAVVVGVVRHAARRVGDAFESVCWIRRALRVRRREESPWFHARYSASQRPPPCRGLWCLVGWAVCPLLDLVSMVVPLLW